MFSKVLVANRGEIAIRIFRTLREMGIASVVADSLTKRESAFVAYADEAYLIGPGPAVQSYQLSETIVRTALRSGAEAVHPGFGFLAENAAFARACAAAGLVFVGPPPDAIEAMGSKTSARELMERAGVPVIPGTNSAVDTVEEALEIAQGIGYPVAVKASAGGGGKSRCRCWPTGTGRSCISASVTARSSGVIRRSWRRRPRRPYPPSCAR